MAARSDEERAAVYTPLFAALAGHPGAASLTPDAVVLRRLDPEPTAADVDVEWGEPDEHGGAWELDDLDDELEPVGLLEDEHPPLAPAWILLPRPAATAEEVRDRGRPPTIAAHAAAVAARAEAFAVGLGLPSASADAVVLAARAHDHGKADRRMQAFFRGGVAVPFAEPLAKSVFGTADRRADQAARAAAGLPRRLRHEIASVAILAQAIERGTVPGGADSELALHLVGTHHGRGRPWPVGPVLAPSDAPPSAFAVDVLGIAGSALGDGNDGWADGAWARRFFDVIERYGAWGAAYLEAIVMLADRTVSAEGG